MGDAPDFIKYRHIRNCNACDPAYGEGVAKALGLAFYFISVGLQTSKSDLVGYMSATGAYVTTHLRQAYEFGGVFPNVFL